VFKVYKRIFREIDKPFFRDVDEFMRNVDGNTVNFYKKSNYLKKRAKKSLICSKFRSAQ